VLEIVLAGTKGGRRAPGTVTLPLRAPSPRVVRALRARHAQECRRRSDGERRSARAKDAVRVRNGGGRRGAGGGLCAHTRHAADPCAGDSTGPRKDASATVRGPLATEAPFSGLTCASRARLTNGCVARARDEARPGPPSPQKKAAPAGHVQGIWWMSFYTLPGEGEFTTAGTRELTIPVHWTDDNARTDAWAMPAIIGVRPRNALS